MSQQFKTKEKFARIICDECIALTQGKDSGERFLTEEEYDRQLDDANRGWRCPSCHCYPCRWDDEYFEREMLTDQQPIPTPRTTAEAARYLNDASTDWQDMANGMCLFSQKLELEVVHWQTIYEDLGKQFESLQAKLDQLGIEHDQITKALNAAEGDDLAQVIKNICDERDKLRKALSEFLEATTDYGGHGMPGFKDRALAYLAISGAKEALNHSKSITQ